MSAALSQPEQFQLPENPMPILVQLGLTYRCNLKCQHCYALYRRDLDEMTLAELKELLRQLYDAGAGSLVYSHGENMIRKDFYDFAGVARDFGLYQTLMANGYYVRDDDDAAAVRDAGVNRVMISIDSSDAAEHDRNRGLPGAYDVALRAARRLKQAGVETVGFSTTIDSHNYGRLQEIVELARRTGVDAISFMQNRYNRPGIFNRQQWIAYVDTCRELYETMLANRGALDIYTHDPFMLTLLDDRLDDETARADFIGANICNVATGMVSIDPSGNVSGCNFIEEVIGNVRKEPFADIWARLVARYSDRVTPPDGPCTSCASNPACMGGCKAFHYNGKYDERCGETRFGDEEPHKTTRLSLPLYPEAPLRRDAGAYARSGRLR